jgi:mono/diheme cytochrome c family protein
VLVSTLVALIVAAPPAEKPAVVQGRKLFHSAALGAHGVACGDCHATVEDEATQGDGKLRAGHTLWGVAGRPYWRGDGRKADYPNLKKAADACAKLFQGTELGGEDGAKLVAFLESISPRRGQPPVVIQPGLEANLDYDRDKYHGGDSRRGRELFFAACHSCHPKGGAGLGPALVGKPTAAIALKVREGNGLLRGKKVDGSWHAFYGKDRLSDAQVADLAAWLQSAE